ncbi:MAG: hypothetical protein ACPGES_08195, partial [Coraliomargarita sp.]
RGLIIPWSWVRTPPGPPIHYELASGTLLARHPKGTLPRSPLLGSGFAISGRPVLCKAKSGMSLPQIKQHCSKMGPQERLPVPESQSVLCSLSWANKQTHNKLKQSD